MIWSVSYFYVLIIGPYKKVNTEINYSHSQGLCFPGQAFKKVIVQEKKETVLVVYDL